MKLPVTAKNLCRVVLFPWGLWSVAAILPRKLRSSFGSDGFGRSLTYVLQGSLYAILLPATFVLLGEGLISANEWLLAEQADYRLQSDHAAGTADEVVELAGPASYLPPPVPEGSGDAYRRYLVELYAPVFVHKVAHHPEWDIPRFIDFDDNDDPRDNLRNERHHREAVPGVYGELTAETEDSYYLTYSLYHVKDYDHPVRERLLRWTYHDNDNEGLHLRVDKATMEVAEVETWFHNRFLFFNRSGQSRGSEPVHGTIHTEDGTHVLVYAQPQGHGVRLVQAVDRPNIMENIKILRYGGPGAATSQRADRTTQTDIYYELRNFDAWYAAASGPYLDRSSRSMGLFEDTIFIGRDKAGRPLHVGRYIGGRDYYIGGWSRPKPMWSWDDGWDDIPILVWHFYPSHSFAAHGGSNLSHVYLFNRPVEKIFGHDPNEFYDFLDVDLEMRPGDKWEGLKERGGTVERAHYWALLGQSIETRLKAYVNYLFHALG